MLSGTKIGEIVSGQMGILLKQLVIVMLSESWIT